MKHIIVTGNIGREPQLKTLANGKDLMSFSVAVNGRKDEPTEWFGIVANDQPKIREFLTKGRQVQVIGRPEFRIYNGQLDLTIFADHIELLGKGREQEPDPSEYMEHFDNE